MSHTETAHPFDFDLDPGLGIPAVNGMPIVVTDPSDGTVNRGHLASHDERIVVLDGPGCECTFPDGTVVECDSIVLERQPGMHAIDARRTIKDRV